MRSIQRHLVCLHALTPIAHGDTVTGVDNATNTRLFMRQGMMVNGQPSRVPSISENALRTVLFRYPLHDHLLRWLEIERHSLPQSVVNLLFSGGSMAAGSKCPGNSIALGHAVKALYPSLDLLGGAVDGFILPRSRMRLAAWIVAREYADAIAVIAPQYEAAAREVSAYDLLTDETRVRGTGDESDGNQMLYTYETLAAGARVLLEVTLDPHTPAATATAIASALCTWDGYIGGQGRQGRGRMTIENLDALPDWTPYHDHLDGHRDAIRNGLLSGTLGTERELCGR